jgi:3',5'-cyclic AMP phosphodiesterase CpdA
MAVLSTRALLASGLLAASGAACGPMSHAPIRPDLLDRNTGRASPPLPDLAPERMRVAVYGDSQGNGPAHRAVIAAILAEKPDLVLFAGDAIDHLPAGHMPDWGGWQYLMPFWPQYVRGYGAVSLASLVPFPAAIHETLLGAVAPPRKAPDLNGWLEETAPLREAGIPILAARGNHDAYHREDEAQFAAIFSPPGGPPLATDAFWYAVDRDGWRFLVLDTGTDMLGDRDPMPAGGPQLAWLESQLAEAERTGRRTIVLLHIPPFSSGKEERGAPWVKKLVVEGILDHHPVALVLSGHIHAYERIVRSGFEGRPVNFVVSGGAGGRFFQRGKDPVAGSVIFVEQVRNFVLLDLGPEGISGRVIPVRVPGEAWRKPPSPLDTFEVALPRGGAGDPASGGRSPSGR